MSPPLTRPGVQTGGNAMPCSGLDAHVSRRPARSATQDRHAEQKRWPDDIEQPRQLVVDERQRLREDREAQGRSEPMNETSPPASRRRSTFLARGAVIGCG